MLWLVGAFDISFGVHGRIPFEDFSNYASTGVGADIGMRYFFGAFQLFGLSLEGGATYFFQKPFSDSSSNFKIRRTSQTNYFPFHANLLMKFYVGENMYALVSLGGGGNYTILNTKYTTYKLDTISNVWTEMEKDKSDVQSSFGYLLNFSFALRLEEFDVFAGVNIFSIKPKVFNLLNGEFEERNLAYSNFYFGVRYFVKFGI
jgi:hypothetical protein